jgi:hypothetical protein
MKQPTRKLTIEIEGITEAQDLAIRDLLSQWVRLGSAGASRWTSFYADGDGNFHPKVLVNGEAPVAFGTEEEQTARWSDDEYRIDFDEIAGELRRSAERAQA